MTINEIVRKYNIKLCEYPPNLWDRAGFYYAPLRTVYINSWLSEKEKKRKKSSTTSLAIWSMTQVNMIDDENCLKFKQTER